MMPDFFYYLYLLTKIPHEYPSSVSIVYLHNHAKSLILSPLLNHISAFTNHLALDLHLSVYEGRHICCCVFVTWCVLMAYISTHYVR